MDLFFSYKSISIIRERKKTEGVALRIWHITHKT